VIFEKDDIETHIVFYSYFVGTNIFREVEKFVLYENKYYVASVYISRYDVSKEEKNLSKKIENWEDGYWESAAKKTSVLVNY